MEEDGIDNKYRRYVTLFDNEGFESIIDITCGNMEKMSAALEDREDPENEIYSLVNTMTLRARFNPQRNPEIWVFWSHIDEETLWKVSQETPQQLADLIRKIGISVVKPKSKKTNVIE